MKLFLGVAAFALVAGTALAQQTPAPQAPAAPAPAAGAPGAQADLPPEQRPFVAGQPIGVTVQGNYTAMSDNVRVFGSLVSVESCSYDEARGLIVAPSRGVGQRITTNDAYVSLINHDGSVDTLKWIGVNRNGFILNEPFGSDIANGVLYLADRDGGTSQDDPAVSVVRMFSMETGEPMGEIRVEDSTGFNDIEVADDGTIYATQTGTGGQNPDPTTWRVYKITPDGEASVIIQGEPLRQPNGIAFDNDGNLVVVQIGNDEVQTYSTEGELITTAHAAAPGSDGIVVLADGTMIVSSVTQGVISRIPAGGGTAEVLAQGVPSAASICFDSDANQIVVPMNAGNALAFIPLD